MIKSNNQKTSNEKLTKTKKKKIPKKVVSEILPNEDKKNWGFMKFIALFIAAIFIFLMGVGGSSEFLSHITVFVLACFVGYMVVWNVSPSLHTPLMSVTNAISGIIVIGGMIHLSGDQIILSLIAVLISTINIVGGFVVTQRMLEMFRK